MRAAPPQLFERVLVGVDRSPASVEAARQAGVLAAPGGRLTVLAVWTVSPPTLGVVSPDLSRELDAEAYREEAERAAEDAVSALTDRSPTAKVVQGIAWEQLINESEQKQDTLLVVGSHGQGRMVGVAMGSTATELIHRRRARCW